MKKKVLFVITKSNWGGAQRYVYNLATALPREEFDVAVALGGTGRAGSDAGELAQKLATVDIPTYYVRSFARDVSLFSDIQALFELFALYRKERPDTVHLNSSKAGGVGALAARLAGVKNILFTSHGLVWDEDRTLFARKAIQLLSWLTFLLSHRVITISQDNFARARALPGCAKKVVHIYNGLPELQFETRERARVSLALKVGLVEGGGNFWIGTIAELTRNKGLSYLIEAAALLKERKFHLFIIGGGEEEMHLQKQITEHGLTPFVHLVGFVSDAYRYNKAFDLFTLTSIKEGLPTVLLEAGQAGVPVVASDIPGVRDIIEDDAGVLVEPKNAAAIAQHISTLLDDRTKRLELASMLHKKVATEFSIERMVEETKKLY